MKSILSISLLLYCSAFINAQDLDSLDKAHNERLSEVLELYRENNKLWLKEMPYFLNSTDEFTRYDNEGEGTVITLKDVATELLKFGVYFPSLPPANEVSSFEFNQFLDKNFADIKYSPVVGLLTNVDVKEVSRPHRLRKVEFPEPQNLSELKGKIKDLRKGADYRAMIPVFWKIGKLGTSKAEKYLIDCANGKHWGMDDCEYPEKILSGIAYSLGYIRTDESLATVMALMNNHELYAVEDWMKAMARLTNRDLVIENQSYQGIFTHYTRLVEGKTVDELREDGYEFFKSHHDIESDDPIDLALAVDHEWWVYENLKKDLLAKEDPKVLYLVASRIVNRLYVYNDRSEDTKFNLFENYEWADIDFDHVEELQRLTGVQLELKSGDLWKTDGGSMEFYIAMINYWRSNYKNYKYDSKLGRFRNKKEEILPQNQLKLLFEKMHREDPEDAMESYIKATEYEPEELIPFIQAYDMDYIMGSLNNALPMFTKKFILRQSEFKSYCRSHGFNYELDEELRNFLEEVRGNDNSFEELKDREKQLLSMLTLENVNAVENYGITYGSRDDDLTNLLGRALDRFYTKSMSSIIVDTSQLKLYITKADIFDGLGIVGVVNNYLTKMYSIHPDSLGAIKSLRTDSDELIKSSAIKILEKNIHTESMSDSSEQSTSFEEFLEIKDDFPNDKLDKVDIGSPENLDSFFDYFAEEEDPDVLFKYIILMDKNSTIEMVPYLLQNLDKREVLQTGYWGGTDLDGKRHTVNFEVQTNDYLVNLIERTYQHYKEPEQHSIFDHQFVSSSRSGPIYLWNKHTTKNYWLEKWESDSSGYLDWGDDYFKENIENLVSADTVWTEDIDELRESKYWNEDEHASLLKGVKEKIPCSDLVYVDPYDSIPGVTLEYMLNRCEPGVESMETIAENYFRHDFEGVMQYMMSIHADSIALGDELTSICWSSDFRNKLKQPENEKHRRWVIKILHHFYQNTRSDFDGKYAESFYWGIKVSGLPLSEQISMISENAGEGKVDAIANVVKDLPFKIIQENWEVIAHEAKSNTDLRSRLQTDHNLYLSTSDLNTAKGSNRIAEIIKNNSEDKAVIKLIDTKINILSSGGELNKKRAFDLLKYGMTDGFVGSGGLPQWNKLHTCLKNLLLEKHEDELTTLRKQQFPKKKENDLQTLLNYCVREGWVESQKYTPISFAGEADTFIYY